MSKGLDALERIKNALFNRNEETQIIKDIDFAIIEKELKEYEKMKRIKGTTTLDNALEETLIRACPNVAKKLKALEIIKNKKVDTSILLQGCSLPEYNEKYKSKRVRLLANEYNLLKEELL